MGGGIDEGNARLPGLGPKLHCGADGVSVGDNSEGEVLIPEHAIAPIGVIILEGVVQIPPIEDVETFGS